jgi:DNA ligase-1
MPIRPMKGVLVDDKNCSSITFPKWASYKLDGIRAVIDKGISISNSGISLPSVWVQELSQKMPHGLDGEWIYGDPVAHDVYSQTFSAVMTRKWPRGMEKHMLKFYAFEQVSLTGTFMENHEAAIMNTHPVDHPWIVIMDQLVVSSLEEMDSLYQTSVTAGYEGLVLRRPTSKYKQGRATLKENSHFKLKPFGKDTKEAVIVGVYPMMTNLNEATTNAFGLTERSTHKENKTVLEVLGGFVVKDVETGVEFRIGGGKGLTMDLRTRLWKKRADLFGRMVRYTSMTYGVKDAPRHPQYRGFRDPIDMTEY